MGEQRTEERKNVYMYSPVLELGEEPLVLVTDPGDAMLTAV